MKKVFVPKGEVVCHNCLYTEKLVVNGVLRVSGKLSAGEITGNGVIEAREIICDGLRMGTVTADFVTAKKIAVQKLFVQFECRASGRIVVSDYVTAGYISTTAISMSLSDICACDAEEIITLPRKKRSLLILLWASWWRSLTLELFHGGRKKQPEAEQQAPESEAEPANAAAPQEPGTHVPGDDATGMLIALLTELQKQGYRVSKTAAVSGAEDAA